MSPEHVSPEHASTEEARSADRVVVVTGAASGIGRGIARWFGDRSARVVAVDRDGHGLAVTVAGILEQGGRARAVTLDITDLEALAGLRASLAEEDGGCDVLVNNAGWEQVAPFLQTDQDLRERLTRINLLGPIGVTWTLAPLMIEAGGGAVVNIASDAGRVGSTGETVYAAAKGGVIAFTKSVARELARHQIVVNCVCPGPTDTPAFARVPQRLQEALVRAIPLRRVATVEDVANAVGFFADPASRYLTGQVLSVSGGLTMAD